MQTQTFNIALPKKLVAIIDRRARQEFRNRSEFIREAVYRYLKDMVAWEEIFRVGRIAGKKLGIRTEAQADRTVRQYRHGKKAA